MPAKICQACTEIQIEYPLSEKFGTRNASDFGGFVTSLELVCLVWGMCMDLSG